MYKPWHCLHCGIEKVGTAHQHRHTYCSKSCMAESYKSRLVGENNPNHKDAGVKVCATCSKYYHSYSKTSKYCSASCYNLTRPVCKKQPKVKAEKPVKASTTPKRQRLILECVKCQKPFTSSPSQKRKYCSYQCHLDSGGAFRAGLAASNATMRYGVKKDANHNELFAEMRKYCAVYDLSTAGNGIPDGVAWINEGWHLFDIKNPKTGYGRRGLNAVQRKWMDQWNGGPVYLLYTVDEAQRFALGHFENLKVYP